jgi:hypothetical protein
MPAPEDNRWHLDRKVPISIIVTMVTLAITGFVAVLSIRSDVDVLKATQAVQNAGQRERDERQDKALFDAVGLVRGDMRDVHNKLDRLIERTPK